MTIVGFYDDIKEMRSSLKLLMQIFVFFIISFAENSLINSFHGLFGIYELKKEFLMNHLLLSCQKKYC